MGVLEIIGWVAFGLNVWGNLALTKVSNRGHVIRLASNACWLVYAPYTGAWALFANHLTFAGINMLGWYRWRKLERAGLMPHQVKRVKAERKAATTTVPKPKAERKRKKRGGPDRDDVVEEDTTVEKRRIPRTAEHDNAADPFASTRGAMEPLTATIGETTKSKRKSNGAQ